MWERSCCEVQGLKSNDKAVVKATLLGKVDSYIKTAEGSSSIKLCWLVGIFGGKRLNGSTLK